MQPLITLVFYQLLGYPILFGGIHLSGWVAGLYGGWDFRITYAVCALLVIGLTRVASDTGQVGTRNSSRSLDQQRCL